MIGRHFFAAAMASPASSSGEKQSLAMESKVQKEYIKEGEAPEPDLFGSLLVLYGNSINKQDDK